MTIDDRRGEDAARTKEKGHAEAQPTSKNTPEHSTEDRALYHPLRFADPVAGWHELGKPARLAQDRKRGKCEGR